LVRIKFLADDLQREGGKFLEALCSFTMGYPSSLVTEFLLRYHLTSEKHEQQLCNNYYVLNYNAYGSAMLNVYTNSRFAHWK
jgi:hypothetical protein